MRIRDVIKRKVDAIDPTTPLWEAARRMNALNVTVLPVCDGPVLVGVLTARDLIIRATSEGCDPHTTLAREVMTREIIYARDDQDVREIAPVLRRYRLARLPVLNRRGRLVGMVNRTDLTRYEVE